MAVCAGGNDQMFRIVNTGARQEHSGVEFFALQNKFMLRLNVFVVKKL